VLILAGLGASRIDVLWVGKAGTFALMFAYPAFLLGHGNAGAGAGAHRGVDHWHHRLTLAWWRSVVRGTGEEGTLRGRRGRDQTQGASA